MRSTDSSVATLGLLVGICLAVACGGGSSAGGGAGVDASDDAGQGTDAITSPDAPADSGADATFEAAADTGPAAIDSGPIDSATTDSAAGHDANAADAAAEAAASNLSVQYECGNTAAATQAIQPWLQIANVGSSPVDLSTLTVRYFFTADGSATQTFACDFAQVGCSNVHGSFDTWTGTNADHYLEVGFTAGAGSVAAGASTGPLQLRFNDQSFMTFSQTNDYSFDATKTAFAAWTRVTLYQAGTLVWGIEP